MRKFWFAIIDIVLVTTISYADSDGDKLLQHSDTQVDSYDDNDDGTKEIGVGDMILTESQRNYLYSTDSPQRLGLLNPFRKWPNASVFYEFDKSLNEKMRRIVTEGMSYIQNVSCVRFIEKDEKTRNYVLIKKGKACSSKIGMRQNGPQPMIIDGNLCTKGNVIHEFLHSLGFLHMHTASIRDEYININWNNIQDDAKLNFERFQAHVGMFDTQYDYDSITHYSNIAFAKNKSNPTIIAKKPAPNMGQRKGMSIGDITRLNRMYNCPDFKVPTIKSNIDSTEGMELQSSNESVIGLRTDDNADTTEVLVTSDDENEIKRSELDLNENNTGNEKNDEEEEDDMVLTEEQSDALFSLKALKRNGLKAAFHHWPRGLVPVVIDRSFSPEFILRIVDAMYYIGNRSCIRFHDRTPYNQNYIYITRGMGCSSEVGMRRSGRQLMNINEKLCPRGKIIHELLHSLGFLHMHTANERDNYIQINWSNIKPKAAANFKQFVAHVSMFSTPYDYNSIMHYSSKAFAIDKSIPTIIPLTDSPNMGQRDGMSQGDVIRLNRMYKCPINWSYLTTTTTTTTTTSPTTTTTTMTTSTTSPTAAMTTKTTPQPSLSSTITPIETSTTEVGVDESKKSIQTLSTKNVNENSELVLKKVVIFKYLKRN